MNLSDRIAADFFSLSPMNLCNSALRSVRMVAVGQHSTLPPRSLHVCGKPHQDGSLAAGLSRAKRGLVLPTAVDGERQPCSVRKAFCSASSITTSTRAA